MSVKRCWSRVLTRVHAALQHVFRPLCITVIDVLACTQEPATFDPIQSVFSASAHLQRYNTFTMCVVSDISRISSRGQILSSHPFRPLTFPFLCFRYTPSSLFSPFPTLLFAHFLPLPPLSSVLSVLPGDLGQSHQWTSVLDIAFNKLLTYLPPEISGNLVCDLTHSSAFPRRTYGFSFSTFIDIF